MTLTAVPRGSPLQERLLARIAVNPATGCWEWTLSRSSTGYGFISLGSRSDGNALVHRVAWELWRGPIPEGLTLDHLCRTRHCCNPDHLEPVTQHENNARGPNARKTHCKHGHEFTSENTAIRIDGSRNCRTCHATVERNRRHARRAEN